MPATAAELQEYIAQANGFETHYKHHLTGMAYSEGVKHIAHEAGAYWLIDAILISSRCRRLQQKCAGLEFWTLTVEDNAAVLACSDGGIGGEKEIVVYTQRIEYTDFPLAAITLYNDGGILCLTGER
ncbi:hypothetical protein BH11PLA2_BH11PLA2_16190 [soil metagenome]